MTKAVPEGYHTVTPYIVVKDAARAIEFYQRAFGAQEVERMAGPDGKGVMHAEFKIGDSRIMIGDEFPGASVRAPESLGGTTSQIFLYVDDVDATYRQAMSAGATEVMAPADMFWGDRYGKVMDPFGHSWGMATHKEDLSTEEMNRRAEAFFKQMGSAQQSGA